MEKQEILQALKRLSYSQGFYGRVLRDIQTEEPEAREEILQQLESQQFKDMVELCEYLDEAYGRI